MVSDCRWLTLPLQCVPCLLPFFGGLGTRLPIAAPVTVTLWSLPYQFGTQSQQTPIPHPPNHPPHFKQRAIKKTILVANLSLRDSNRPSHSRASRFEHTVVTHVIISLNSDDCSVSRATECVQKQIGLEVVLLDSKLFPIMDNNSTSEAAFWCSTRKIIAVSRASYEKLSGNAVGEELGQVKDDVQPPSKRSKTCDFTENFEMLNKKLESIKEKLSFAGNFAMVAKKIFECVICKWVVNSPIVSKRCQRIIGCRACVSTWCSTSSCCPLCSVSGRMDDVLKLKGLDDVISFLRVGDSENESTMIAVDTGESTSDDNFEDLPNFSVSASR